MKIRIFFIFILICILIIPLTASCFNNLIENMECIGSKNTETSINSGNQHNLSSSNDSSNSAVPVFKPDDKLLFVLQCACFCQLHESDFDIAVVDCDDTCLTVKEILMLKKQNKRIISYLSIGEAENYRSYWQQDWKTGYPDFLDEENPNWPGNYKVRFWYPKWQEIIFSKLEEIACRGYDGVYLDLVDAYKYYEDKGYENAEHDMVEFIKEISMTAKKINPQFLIIPQNAEELAKKDNYLKAVDGLGRESLWFEKNKCIKDSIMADVLEDLCYASDNNKFIFAISYADNDSTVQEFLQLCDLYGFIPYVGPAELDTIK